MAIGGNGGGTIKTGVGLPAAWVDVEFGFSGVIDVVDGELGLVTPGFPLATLLVLLPRLPIADPVPASFPPDATEGNEEKNSSPLKNKEELPAPRRS